jgi:hypothetical protein
MKDTTKARSRRKPGNGHRARYHGEINTREVAHTPTNNENRRRNERGNGHPFKNHLSPTTKSDNHIDNTWCSLVTLSRHNLLSLANGGKLKMNEQYGITNFFPILATPSNEVTNHLHSCIHSLLCKCTIISFVYFSYYWQ